MEDRVVIVETDNLTENGDLVFDLYTLLQAGWQTGKVIIATPKISHAALEPLRLQLRANSDADSLDLDALIFWKFQEGKESASERWPLGWDDGNRISVYIYTKEYFDSDPRAREFFDTTLIAQILD